MKTYKIASLICGQVYVMVRFWCASSLNVTLKYALTFNLYLTPVISSYLWPQLFRVKNMWMKGKPITKKNIVNEWLKI